MTKFKRLLKKLPAKRQRFVMEYLVDSNGKQAAIRAGYAKKAAAVQAADILIIPNVKEALAAGRAEQAEKIDITIEYVVNSIKKVAERCLQDDTFDSAGANRALENLAKYKGVFEKDNRQRAGLNDLTTEELQKIAQGD